LNAKLHIANAAFRYDLWRARLSKAAPPGLRIYVFHSLFANEAERDSGLVFPHEGITVSQFEAFVRLNLERGVRFVGPESLARGDDKREGPAILISFDDGYANNLRAIAILERYNIPALFCVITKHIRSQKPFWWDTLTLYLNRDKITNKSDVLAARKTFLPEENDQWVRERIKGLIPKVRMGLQNGIGLPMTIDQLRQFAAHPLVHIGNHSHSHPLFDRISEDRMHEEMETSQQLLKEWLGKAPSVMAWPNGSFSKQSEDIVRQYGIQYAFGTQRHWYHGTQDLPFSPGRVPLYGIRDVKAQLEVHEHAGSRWWEKK
jgi:peptidoglycan/xylan/chitin deacetylase (PgdA/CDA1 family)